MTKQVQHAVVTELKQTDELMIRPHHGELINMQFLAIPVFFSVFSKITAKAHVSQYCYRIAIFCCILFSVVVSRNRSKV